ncbi:hypothetical protein QZH56_18960 [Streptomyces olivoreticuli]|uniref:hypothetical protein n=1 Tax=Streptomyces olivoreticuli TaxID=68246 RepID=UPI00265AE542|nr:hypothetical protein [Streptomyces olivoreticuli]WKK20974.1 hypothetical protein QZH56_18960 [Streptomyces olivoreticuli]
MATEIEEAAAQVAKLQAQAEKLSGPLADAEAQLRAAEEMEATRRAERATEYNREVVNRWSDRAQAAANSGDTAREKFYAALSEEPWFAAYVEFRAARYRRGHVLTEAQRAQAALREEPTVPEQRWYAAHLLEDIVNHADRKAAELSAEFAQELDDRREAYISGTD